MHRTIAIVLAVMAFSCGGEASSPGDDAGSDADACTPGDFACSGTTALICNDRGVYVPTLAPYCDGTVRE